MSCDNGINEGAEDSVEEFADLPEGVPSLRSLYLYLTDYCNLRCQHCWITPKFTNETPQHDFIDFDSLQHIVHEGKKIGLKHAKLTGGEPFLHPQFVDVVRFLKSEEIRFDIETNGTLLNEDIIDAIKDVQGCNISVSLDSCDPSKHDKFRGVEGAFDLAVRAIKALVKEGITPQVIISLYKDNVEEIDGMANFCEQLGAGSMKINPIQDTGRANAIKKSGNTIDYDEIIRINNYVHSTMQARHAIQILLHLPPAFNKIGHLLNNHSCLGTCGVRNVLGVLGTGDFALCGIGRNFKELQFGKIRENNVIDIWTKHPVLNSLRATLAGHLPGVCGDCIHGDRCLAGCVAMNYSYSGKLVSPDHMCAEYEKRNLFPSSRRKSI